jgi:hypothetical protein
MIHEKVTHRLIPVALLACNSASKNNRFTNGTAKKKDGWQVLFDGTSKNSWHIYNNNQMAVPGKCRTAFYILIPKPNKAAQAAAIWSPMKNLKIMI